MIDGEKNALVTVNYKEGQVIRFPSRDGDFMSKHYDIRYELGIIEGRLIMTEMRNFEREERNGEDKKEEEVSDREDGEIVSDEEEDKEVGERSEGEVEKVDEGNEEGKNLGKKDNMVEEVEGENKIGIDEGNGEGSGLEKKDNVVEDGESGLGGGKEMETEEEDLNTSGSLDSEDRRMGDELEKKLNEENVGIIAEESGGGLNVVEERKESVYEELKGERIKERVDSGKNENVRKRKIPWRFEEGEGSGIGNTGPGEVKDVLKEILRSENGSPPREKKR